MPRAAAECRTRVHECEAAAKSSAELVKETQKEWRTAQEKVSEAVDRIIPFETRIEEAESVAKNVHGSLETMHSRIWNDTSEALNKIKLTQDETFQENVEKACTEAEKRSGSLATYALNIFARAANERRASSLKQAVIRKWREHNWDTGRRRLGCIYLNNFLRMKVRRSFDSWKHNARLESVLARQLEDLKTWLPDIPAIVGSLTSQKIAAIHVRRPSHSPSPRVRPTVTIMFDSPSFVVIPFPRSRSDMFGLPACPGGPHSPAEYQVRFCGSSASTGMYVCIHARIICVRACMGAHVPP
eukprot:GHVU01088435.1.p1 GENE.GHVU01088435.1~~GHVU01088435.1.p1  ORF type:complete len:300 (-),score=24.31 GHVU01088435.1:1176-2075(-)